jgi:plastocyanin
MMPLLFLILLSLTSFVSCSSDSPSAAPTSPTLVIAAPPAAAPAPAGPPTITITASGMNPLEITIAVGQAVTFINNDVRAHDVVGGIDPAHPDCPEILQFLTPGQRSDTGTFMRARTCEYHDHTMLGVPAFQGRIVIR